MKFLKSLIFTQVFASFVGALLVCVLILGGIILSLDLIERKKERFSLLLDHGIPSIFLFSPFLFLGLFDAEWKSRIFYFLLFQMFVSLPFFTIWSRYRNWTEINDLFYDWRHPRVLHQLCFSFLYLSLWSLYFSFIRYLRIGGDLDFSPYWAFIWQDWFFLLVVVFYPFLLLGILFSVRYVQWIKQALWSHVAILGTSFHVYCLRFSWYFFLMYKFYRLGYILYAFTNLYGGPVFFYPIEKENIRWYQHLLYRLLYFPSIKYLFCLALLGELLWTRGHLSLGLYLLFLYPLGAGLSGIIVSFWDSLFVFHTCYSDYMQKRFANPRFPQEFWNLVEADGRGADFWFGFSWALPQDILDLRKKIKPLPLNSISLSLKSHYTTPAGLYKFPWRFRFLWGFRVYGVRWVHTAASPRLHKGVGLFARSVFEKMALLDHDWRLFYPMIEKHNKVLSPYENMKIYKPGLGLLSVTTVSTNIAELTEVNTTTLFADLHKEKVYIDTWKDRYITSNKTQERPDVYQDFAASTFSFQGTAGIDLKSVAKPGVGFNKILALSPDKYKNVLEFYKKMNFKQTWFKERESLVQKHLSDLKSSFNTPSHVKVWASFLHLYPERFLPPLGVVSPIHKDAFTVQSVEEFQKAQIWMDQLSDEFFRLGIPEYKTLEEFSSDPKVKKLLEKYNSEDRSLELSPLEVD